MLNNKIVSGVCSCSTLTPTTDRPLTDRLTDH